MSDFPASTGQGNGFSSRAAMGSSASPAGKLRTPTDIMRDRKARDEARRAREEQQAAAPQQASMLDLERRDTAARRAAAGGFSTRDSGYRSASVGGHTPADQAHVPPTMQGVAPQVRQRERSGYDSRQNVPSPYDAGDLPSQPAQQPTRRQPVQQQEPVPPRVSSATTTAAATAAGQPRVHQSAALQPRQSQGSSQARASAQTASIRGTPGQPPEGPQQQRSSNVSSFPHAFERWETLSSRWEGLTSYWLRKLESNIQSPKGDINSEMARQITDLAAAGANLFHAVVELQRLRASSERKFQRWFYETRAQQEQAQEDQTRVRQMYDQERAAREQQRQEHEEELREQQAMRNQDRLLQEYKRELQIAKDEAKRAWEELGRREQAERERIYSLKEGHTIDIGGVQVVPHGAPSRGGSQRSAPQEASYSQPPQQQAVRTTTQAGVPEPQPPSPTDTDPFSRATRGAVPTAPRSGPTSSYSQGQTRSTTQPSSGLPAGPILPSQSSARGTASSTESPSARFYSHQQGTSLHGQGPSISSSAQAYAGSDPESDIEWEVDSTGHIRHDSAGNPLITYRSTPGTSAVGDIRPGPAPQSGGRQSSTTADILEPEHAVRSQNVAQVPHFHTVPAPHSVETSESPTRDSAEYDGRDYPEDELEWAELQQQRHQHPTRLSDVPEEDEHSRGSMSRPSRGSEGMF